MLNFIIYEDNAKARELYKSIVTDFIGGKMDGYNISSFGRYEDYLKNGISKLLGKKIYILDIEVPGKNGLDFARDIRASGDWLSQIIIISNYDNYRQEAFTSKMLTLDFISKRDNVPVKLKETLSVAYKITTTHLAFTFQYNSELYRIPYQDILFIKKELNDNYSLIITERGSYRIKKSIKKIEKELANDARFFKTHQSCIVNLYNITSVNLTDSIIYFKNKKTDLLTRDRKTPLKEKLANSTIIE